MGFSPIHFGMSLGILLVQLTSRWSFKRNFMGLASDIMRRQNVTENSLTLRILSSFHPSSGLAFYENSLFLCVSVFAGMYMSVLVYVLL